MNFVKILRSFDQFSNLVLEEASERKVHCDSDGVIYFADVPLGVYVIRGDSMVLLGQVAPDDGMKEVEPKELQEMIEKSNKEELGWDFDNDLLA
jgi:U6 snRNA-associated Sm-like protein LSm1